MTVFKDDTNPKKWRVQLYYKDAFGKNKRIHKRGFERKKDAQEWERNFLNSIDVSPEITFENLVFEYLNDMESRLRESTIFNKTILINTHLIPYFKDMKIENIKPITVRKWQNKLLKNDYSETYLKTINNQFNAIMNYAVKYYNLSKNPGHAAGTIGRKNADEKDFWTLDEFNTFINVIENKEHKLIFNLLYFTGMRIGELLALTPNDFHDNYIDINKNYVVTNGVGKINPPKTPKGNRIIYISDFIIKDTLEYISTLYRLKNNDRIFMFARSYPAKLMDKYCKLSGVKKIRTHDLRHSHVSLLIELGVNITTISDRLGHEKVDTTWNTYAHLYPNQRQDVVYKIDDAISQLRQNNAIE